jgi:hypothetical protein
MLVSVVKLATVLECSTEELCSTARFFLWAEGLNAKDINKAMSSLCGGSVLTRKWLRKQSKDFHATGFGTLIKRCDKCINVSGGYVEK